MKNSARGIVNPDRKIYYRTIVMNTLWCWQNKIKKKRYMDRCNKFEDSSMSSHEFSLSDIKQSEKKATLKKNRFFNK